MMLHSPASMPSRAKIPRPTVKRLSLYLRELESQATSPPRTISSRQLGNALGLTDAQVRKDLAYFGQFGHPGVGYQFSELTTELRHILGTDRSWRAIVVGAGNIGRAVINSEHLANKGFAIIAVVDSDPGLIGTTVGGHRVRPISDLTSIITAENPEIGMVAVPANAAQSVTDELIAAGVKGLLNFAPVRLKVDDSVAIVSVDLTVSLEQLAYKITLGLTGEGDETPRHPG